MEKLFIAAFKEVVEIEDIDISLSDHFRDYPSWDSLAQMSVVAMLDEMFNVSIELNDFNKLDTVGDLMNEVRKRMVFAN